MALPYEAAPSHPTRDRGTAHPAPLPWYRRESWLLVSLIAFLPVCFAVVAPPAWRIPLVALTGVLMVVALVLMLRRDRLVRAEEARERSLARPE